MKKLVLLFAAFAVTASVSAQTVAESQIFDNIYVGVNGGVATKTTGHSWMRDLDPNFGVRIGRYFTPVFGLAIEGNAYLSNKPWPSTGTAIRDVNASLLGTVNLSNLFGKYPGEPRTFEVSAIYGLGWNHVFNKNQKKIPLVPKNRMSSKAALDFAFNFGSEKQFQIYIEPSINWLFLGQGGSKYYEEEKYEYGYGMASNDYQPAYDLHNSWVQLNAGVVYKFKNSNGTHNFTIVVPRDQAEIDALNAQINDLRNQLAAKDRIIAEKDAKIRELQAALDACNARKCPECPKVKTTATNLQPMVLFKKNSSTIEKAQYAPVELIANYMKNHPEAQVEICGYASIEGPKDINDRLSNERAQAVKTALVKKYGIDASRLTAVGNGATDKLFEELEFNRVATFNDNSKK